MEAARGQRANSLQCWECRRRRLVCDNRIPACGKCQTRRVACPGYGGRKPLVWVSSQQQGRCKQKQPGSGTRSLSGKEEEAQQMVRVVPPTLKCDRGVREVFEAVEYYNTAICPDLVATGVGGAGSPFFMPVAAVASFPRVIIENIVCTALCHRVLQVQDDSSLHVRSALTAKLYRHRGESIRELAELLGRPGELTSDTTLASVLSILLVEIQQTFSSDWQKHSRGASVIIDMRGGLGELVFTKPSLRHLLLYYAIVDVIGFTTSPATDLRAARRQLDMIRLLPVLYGNGLGGCVPCPPEIFAQIIRINYLRAQFQCNAKSTKNKPAAGMTILGRIMTHPVDGWAFGTAAATAKITLSSWLSVARIYQYAAAIYCIAVLLDGDDMDEVAHHFPLAVQIDRDTEQSGEHHLRIKHAKRSCHAMLITQLQNIKNTCNQLRKLVIWPLVIAGIEADDENTQQFVLGELAWISKTLGIAAPLLGREFLQTKVWANNIRARTWEDLFDRAYLFAM